MLKCYSLSRCGGIGRRKGLKIPRPHSRAGSSPASGTKKGSIVFGRFFFLRTRTGKTRAPENTLQSKEFLGRGAADDIKSSHICGGIR